MDPKAIQANFDARQHAVAELRSLYDTTAGREMSGEERAKEERLNEAITGFDARIKEGLRAIEAEAADAEARAQFAALTEARGNTPAAQDKDADAIRSLLKGEVRSVDFMPTRDEVRSLQTGKTGSAAANGEGNIVHTLYGALHEEMREWSTVVAANAEVMRTAGGNDIVIPRISGYSVATRVGEAQTITESDPEFGPLATLKAYGYKFLLKVSTELVNDEAYDLISFLARQGGEALGAGIGIELLTGTGVDQPNGLVNATTGVTLAGNALTYDETIDIFHSVSSLYRKNAVWVFNDSSVASLRKIKDTEGRPMWQPGMVPGAPDTLLGKPVLTDPGMPTLADDSAKAVIFGDVRRAYTVRYSGALRVERSDEFAFDTDQVTFRFIQRADGEIIDTKAVRTAVTPAP